MSILGTPWVAAVGARIMQTTAALASGVVTRRTRSVFPEIPGDTREITIPTPIAPARAVVYRPVGRDPCPPVHVNFHGGGYIMRGVELDDPLCRYLAAEAGVVVVNVDYAVAPRHRFPAPPHQAFEVVAWITTHGAEHGWDGGRVTIGGQSAGGGLAAAVARQAWEHAKPAIGLQVLHYPPLDLTTPCKDKPSMIAKPMLRPWMGEIFDSAYVPDPAARSHRLVSPAAPSDTTDLTGISPALIITPEHDRLHDEGRRYAERLRKADALLKHHNVPRADHGYDMTDIGKARRTYALIADYVKLVTRP